MHYPLASSSVHTCLPLPPTAPQLLHPKRQRPEAALPPSPHLAAKATGRPEEGWDCAGAEQNPKARKKKNKKQSTTRYKGEGWSSREGGAVT